MPRIIKSKTKESETTVDNHDEEVIVKKVESKAKIIEVSDGESEKEEKPKAKTKVVKKTKTNITTKEEKIEKPAEDTDEEEVAPEPVKVEKKNNTKLIKKTDINTEENWVNMNDEEAHETHNISEVSDNEDNGESKNIISKSEHHDGQFKKTFKPSIADFDNEEIWKIDQEKLKEIDTNTLLKVLMVRGMKNNNPTLFGKSKGLLKDLNFEPPYFKSNNHFNKDSYNNRNYRNNDSGNTNNVSKDFDNNATNHFTKNSYNRNYRNNGPANDFTNDVDNSTNTFEAKENTEFKPSNNFNGGGFRGGRGGFNRGGYRGGFRGGFRDNNRGGFSSGFTKKTEE